MPSARALGLTERRIGCLTASFEVIVPDSIKVGSEAVLDCEFTPGPVYIEDSPDFIKHGYARRVRIDHRSQIQLRDLAAVLALRSAEHRAGIRNLMFKTFNHGGQKLSLGKLDWGLATLMART